MIARIETLKPKLLVGTKLRMSMAQNTTGNLWAGFMPRLGEIKNRVDDFKVSLQQYDDTSYFEEFKPTKQFTKWAAVEVSSKEHIPEGMEVLELPKGMYAVFLYRGLPSDAAPFFEHIFGTWIPLSDYELDLRPHFEILGEMYKKDDPSSEEEVWIPIKFKSKKSKGKEAIPVIEG